MNLEHFAQMRALQEAYTSTNRRLIDYVLRDGGDQVRERLKLKRLQFDTSEQMHAEVERLCARLDCSKREFLESAVSDALERAERVFEKTLAEVADDAGMSVMVTAIEPVDGQAPEGKTAKDA